MTEVVRQVANALDPAAIIVDGIKFAGAEIGSTAGNYKSLHDNYDSLVEKVKKLYERRDEVVDRMKSDQSKQASKKCNQWVDKVHNIETEVCDLYCKYIDKFEHLQLNHPIQRSNLSETIMKMCDKVHDCWEKGSKFLTEALVDKPPECVIKIRTPPKIENYKSLQGIIDKILENLKTNEDIKRIGLWGKVGVGKTTILQNLNNDEKVAELFDLVIFATLQEQGSEDTSQAAEEKLQRAKEKLQLEIAQRLMLNMEGISNDIKEIASRISDKLKHLRYLLILDEVWGTFSLDDIGIVENEQDSMVVFASRNFVICSHMNVDKDFEVSPLSEHEARQLFFEKLGRKMTQPDIDYMAESVVEECFYLPLLIDRVASTFKKIEATERQLQQRKASWQNALERLQGQPDDQSDGMGEFLKRLRYCYEQLDDDKKKMCFLYAALYPSGYEIHEQQLQECWRAEGFIANTENLIIRDLVAVSLLEDCEKMNHIRMNKVLRSLALKILSECGFPRYLVRAGENLLLEPPGEEEWNGVKWISLMDSNLSSLPANPGCNNLSTLMLQGNDDLTLIPDSFFLSMGGLCVLNLHGTGITALPESISCLTDLRALYLNSCNQLEKLPPTIIALRDKLEVLDIRDTGINCFPGEIKDLLRLRCLRLSLSNIGDKAWNVSIDQGIISKLFYLEELLIVVDPQNGWWNELLISVSNKLPTLKKWNTNPRHFQISIGEDQSISIIDHPKNKIGRRLKYANGEGTSHDLSGVLAGAKAFELTGHSGRLKLSDFGMDHISNIKSCVIDSCPKMETIIHATDLTKGVLECLEKMYVSNLPKLRSTWEGVVPSKSLVQLTTLSFFKCPKLKNIFSRGMIQQLEQLQHLTVQDCDAIEKIVSDFENNGSEPGKLPRLKTLILRNLPKLECKWTASLLRSSSLKSSEISECQLQTELLGR